MSKHTEILQDAVTHANNAMSTSSKSLGMEWELDGSQLILRHLHARTPDLVHYGHYDVLDYRDNYIILVWVDDQGTQLDSNALICVNDDNALQLVVDELQSIQHPDSV